MWVIQKNTKMKSVQEHENEICTTEYWQPQAGRDHKVVGTIAVWFQYKRMKK